MKKKIWFVFLFYFVKGVRGCNCFPGTVKTIDKKGSFSVKETQFSEIFLHIHLDGQTNRQGTIQLLCNYMLLNIKQLWLIKVKTYFVCNFEEIQLWIDENDSLCYLHFILFFIKEQSYFIIYFLLFDRINMMIYIPIIILLLIYSMIH